MFGCLVRGSSEEYEEIALSALAAHRRVDPQIYAILALAAAIAEQTEQTKLLVTELSDRSEKNPL